MPTRRLCALILTAFLLSGLDTQPVVAASLLLTGTAVKQHTLPGILLTPDNHTLLAVDVYRSLNGGRFDANDIIELDLASGRYQRHPDTTAFDVLTGSTKFSGNNLLREVAVHTPAKPWFLVGYGRDTINQPDTVVYVGKLIFELYKPLAVAASTFDFDSDGITDSAEQVLGTSALQFDTDGDGLLDGDETALDGDSSTYTPGVDLDPLDTDTDGDGFSDSFEIDYGTDPLDPASQPVDGDINVDGVVDASDVLLAIQITQGMRIPDAVELVHGDVAPLIGGVPAPDGVVNTADILVIQRKALGEVNF